jgi:bifunctional oligoribonuclease and PAP phosphatase NrnA
MMEDWHPIDAILNVLHTGHRFLVVSHARPDGDALGSMLACAMFLEQLGKQVDLLSGDRIPLIYRFLPGINRVRISPCVDDDYDAILLLECDGIPRTGLKGLDGRFLINIDHHASGRNFADINWIEAEASSTGELIYDLALAAGACITASMATCLYTALLTDTGSFRYQGTRSRTFELAQHLVELGADPIRVAQDVYFANPMSKMLLLGAALNNLQREGQIAWLSITNQDVIRTRAADEDCEGVVNYAICISGVEVAVFLRELPDNRVRLSLRSKGAVNVARIAERFGGGGHNTASGCTLDLPLPEATDQILSELRQAVSTAVSDVA